MINKQCKQCNHPLKSKANERPYRFSKREFCNRACSNKWKGSQVTDTKTKICSYCKIRKSHAEFYMLRTKSLSSQCKLCSKKNHNKRRQARLLKQQDEPWIYLSKLLDGAMCRSRKKPNLTFSITLDDIKKQWSIQNGKCFYSGAPLTFVAGRGRNLENVSLDRKNSTIGYERGNVVLCTLKVNIAKSSMDIDEFVSMCKQVVINMESNE